MTLIPGSSSNGDRVRAPTTQAWVLLFLFTLVFVQGVIINLTPIALPTLKQVFALEGDKYVGMVRTAEACGWLPALLLGGFVARRLKPRLTGTLAVVLMGAGALTMAMADTIQAVVVALFILGFGNQLVLAVHCLVVSDFFYKQRQRMYLLLMAVLAIGAIFGPYPFGYALHRVGTEHWQNVYLGLAFILWGLITVVLLIGWRHLNLLGRRYNDLRPQNFPPGNADEPETASGKEFRQFLQLVFSRWALYLLGLIVVFDNLAMTNANTWTPTFAQLEFGVSEEQTGFMMSMMAVGVLIGRLLLAIFFSGRFSDRKLLGYCYGASMVMFSLMLLAPSFWMAVVFWTLMSFFMSVQSATTYAIGSEKFKGAAGVAIPIVDGIGTVGALVGPILMGYLSDTVGSLRGALWLVPAFGFALTALSLGWDWVETRRPEHVAGNTGLSDQ